MPEIFKKRMGVTKMGHQLILELSNEVYEQLANVATLAGQTLEDWAMVSLLAYLPKYSLSESNKEDGLQSLIKHFGAVDLGYPTGADNEQIDADLAREYANTHEEK